MNTDQQIYNNLANPVCKQTYQSLPKIYGGKQKQKASFNYKRQSLHSVHKHYCLLHISQQIKKLPTNKKYNKAKTKYLSMPKTQKCSKLACQCYLIHQKNEKTLRKVNSPQIKMKIKLKSFVQEKPDDFQSKHKVVSRNITEPSMPTGIALITKRLYQNQVNKVLNRKSHNKIKSKSQIYGEQNGKSVSARFPVIRSALNCYQQANSPKAAGFLNKEVASVEIQVNLSEDAIEKRSQKNEDTHQKTKQLIKRHQKQQYNKNKPIKSKVLLQRFKKISSSQKNKPHKNQQKNNQQSQQLQKQQINRNKQNPRQNQFKNSTKSQSSLSINSKLIKNSGQTWFQKLESKYNEQSLKSSRAKSTKTNGTFRVPAKQDYISYLRGYNVLDKKNFDVKQLLKKPLFSIIEEDQGVYFGEYEKQSKNGTGINVTQKQIFEGIYEGNIKIKGCERNIDGVYRGYFMNGKREGYGTFQWNNGQKFQGNWKDGVKCGFGIWRSPKGDSYEGEWFNNRQHGQGVFKHRNSLYKGQFKDFLKHGKGFETFLNGDVYEGNYKFGKPDGIGKYTWHEGVIYQGQFKNGIRCGRGKLSQVNGNIYEGQFKKDIKQGQGIQYFKNGNRFEGQFKNNQPFKGTLYKKQGQKEFINNS